MCSVEPIPELVGKHNVLYCSSGAGAMRQTHSGMDCRRLTLAWIMIPLFCAGVGCGTNDVQDCLRASAGRPSGHQNTLRSLRRKSVVFGSCFLVRRRPVEGVVVICVRVQPLCCHLLFEQ